VRLSQPTTNQSDPFATLFEMAGLDLNNLNNTPTKTQSNATISTGTQTSAVQANSSQTPAAATVNSTVPKANSSTPSSPAPTQPTQPASSSAQSAAPLQLPTSFKIAASASELYGKWLPFETASIPALSKYGATAFSKYQLIIN
jgi:hypothetical protein